MLHGTANGSYNMKHLLAIASLSGPTRCRVLLAVDEFVPHDSHLLLLHAVERFGRFLAIDKEPNKPQSVCWSSCPVRCTKDRLLQHMISVLYSH